MWNPTKFVSCQIACNCALEKNPEDDLRRHTVDFDNFQTSTHSARIPDFKFEKFQIWYSTHLSTYSTSTPRCGAVELKSPQSAKKYQHPRLSHWVSPWFIIVSVSILCIYIHFLSSHLLCCKTPSGSGFPLICSSHSRLSRRPKIHQLVVLQVYSLACPVLSSLKGGGAARIFVGVLIFQ